MSYMQFQQECKDCGKTWNAAFGIVGTTYIAQPPEKCPHCGSQNLKKIADEWKFNECICEWEPITDGRKRILRKDCPVHSYLYKEAS